MKGINMVFTYEYSSPNTNRRIEVGVDSSDDFPITISDYDEEDELDKELFLTVESAVCLVELLQDALNQFAKNKKKK